VKYKIHSVNGIQTGVKVGDRRLDEISPVEKGSYITHLSGHEVVHDADMVSPIEKGADDIGANEPGASGNKIIGHEIFP